VKKPESRLQLKIRKRLEEEVGGWWIKVWGGPFQQGGLPDLFGCVKGYFIGIEVKIPGKEPTELQYQVLGHINDNGGLGIWVDSVEEAVEKVQAFLASKISKAGSRVRPKG